MADYELALAKMYEERLRNFYRKYEPSKTASIPALLAKYKGNEEKLIRAMVQKYGARNCSCRGIDDVRVNRPRTSAPRAGAR